VYVIEHPWLSGQTSSSPRTELEATQDKINALNRYVRIWEAIVERNNTKKNCETLDQWRALLNNAKAEASAVGLSSSPLLREV